MILAGCGVRACPYVKCKKLFVPKTPDQRFCCTQHRWRHNFRLRYAKQLAKKKKWKTKICAGCKKPFSVSTRGKGRQHREHCTEQCARRVYNRRYYARQKAGLVKARSVSNRFDTGHAS